MRTFEILIMPTGITHMTNLPYNVLSATKRKALPQAWWPARLKVLRFHLIGNAARIIEHGRKLFLKIAKHHPSFHLYKEAREKLLLFSSA